MCDVKSVYPWIESGCSFQPHTNNVYKEVFNKQTFNQDNNESANLTITYYSPPTLILQHIGVTEKIDNHEVNCMRNGYIIDVRTLVDI